MGDNYTWIKSCIQNALFVHSGFPHYNIENGSIMFTIKHHISTEMSAPMFGQQTWPLWNEMRVSVKSGLVFEPKGHVLGL